MGIRTVAFLESCDTPLFWMTKMATNNLSILAHPAPPCAIRWVGGAPIPLTNLFLVEGEVAMNLRAPRSDGPSPRLSIRPHDVFMRTICNHPGQCHRGVEATSNKSGRRYNFASLLPRSEEHTSELQ